MAFLSFAQYRAMAEIAQRTSDEVDGNAPLYRLNNLDTRNYVSVARSFTNLIRFVTGKRPSRPFVIRLIDSVYRPWLVVYRDYQRAVREDIIGVFAALGFDGYNVTLAIWGIEPRQRDRVRRDLTMTPLLSVDKRTLLTARFRVFDLILHRRRLTGLPNDVRFVNYFVAYVDLPGIEPSPDKYRHFLTDTKSITTIRVDAAALPNMAWYKVNFTNSRSTTQHSKAIFVGF